MNSLWYLYDTEFSADVCADILGNWNDFEAQKGKVGDKHFAQKESVRSSKINKFPYGTPQQAEFQKLLEPFITVANRECFGFNLNGFCEFQIAEYNVGDFYVEHIDTNINDSESHRKLSITLQLTDPNLYDGGDFQFGCNIANPTSETLRQKGSMLLFPSFLPHSVYKVTRGKRYALVGWYEGKKWS